MTVTATLLREMYTTYASSVGLQTGVTYFNGTPLLPVVPLDTAINGLFILGAYPSAKCLTVGGISDVPCGDNRGPFEEERWFDGRRVRVQASAAELRDLFLDPLKIRRDECWITDLVKVFLFKPGHEKRYAKLGGTVPPGYTRSRFYDLGGASLEWIGRELQIAQPKLVITLGAEVAGVLHNVRSSAAQTKLLVPEPRDLAIGGREYTVVHCAHPGILMRRDPANPWPEKHKHEFLPVLRQAWGWIE